MDKYDLHKSIVDSTTKLYRSEIPDLVGILGKVRNFGTYYGDQMFISATPIILILSIVSILNNQGGAGTLKIMHFNNYAQELKKIINAYLKISDRNIETIDEKGSCYNFNLLFTN
jgi:hypothetical protein